MLISIIVPVYNVEKYLEKCIDSLLCQDLDDYEIILINDGSTDGSIDICLDYAKKYPSKVILINKINEGQSVARNLGFEISRGDFISFVDSDDWIDPFFCSKMLSTAIQSNSDIVACNMNMMNSKGEFKSRSSQKSKMYANPEAMLEMISNQTITFSPCNKIFRRKLLENFKFKENFILEDMELMFKIIYSANQVFYLSNPLYYYRYNINSTLRSKFKIEFVNEYYIYGNMINFYRSNNIKGFEILYYKKFITAIRFYSQLCVYYPNLKFKYESLLDIEKTELLKLLVIPNLTFTERLNVVMFLCAKEVYLMIRIEKTKLNARRSKHVKKD